MSYLRFRFRHKQTIATVLVDTEDDYERAVKAMLKARKEIEEKITRDPLFFTTLDPYECHGEIVGRMCHASKLANVGPMAAVAGTIAQYAVEEVSRFSEFIVVDNGGDIAIYTDRELIVGIYPSNLGFRIEPEGKIRAVCTSSGKIGHSISFGYADAATVVGSDACIADAFATALGNMIKEDFGKNEIEEALEEFWQTARKHVDGAMVVKDDVVGVVGELPEIVKVNVSPDLITKG
ncbi:UPF0280 family protein [Archaeoglobus veneficus]|uniref:UPF0280 protein Arcve_1083 n=1 Tax=Archaeoglobus veneficus (strain DSM 11195 / SNP6) TaxID=693661 RepID=F2KT63_ARCVS|nr:UPF0280 family protein [Archaeoglobus veneficus]AEA47093.1 UPF0280 protein [Archaeoglobus veneficus SNP6]